MREPVRARPTTLSRHGPAALLILLGILLAGCGQAQSAAQSGPPAASATPALSAAPATSSPPASSSAAQSAADLYFTAGGKLSPVAARVSSSDPARDALQQLLKGPVDSRHSTEIPASTQLNDVSIAGATASVSFGAAFYAQGGATGTLLRLAQVVYTVTQFPGVTSVRFLQDGQPMQVIGEGFPLNRPLARQDFAQFQP